MRFDVIIIGGGLAGLTCGLRLQKNGKKCAIISAGQSAMHFSSGTFDLLGRMPDGTEVESPAEMIGKLGKEHPYTVIGAEKVLEYALSNDWSDIIIGRNSLIYPIAVGASGNPQTGVSIDGDKRPSSTRKLVCPCCGNSVRATKTVRIMCMDCMVQMQEL